MIVKFVSPTIARAALLLVRAASLKVAHANSNSLKGWGSNPNCRPRIAIVPTMTLPSISKNGVIICEIHRTAAENASDQILQTRAHRRGFFAN